MQLAAKAVLSVGLCLPAEGISYGLDFKKALKDSEDSQLVKFQGSPQVRGTIALVDAGTLMPHEKGACWLDACLP